MWRRKTGWKSWRAAFLLTAAAIIFGEGPALAYVDPATSGVAMQLAAPIIIAVGVLRNKLKLVVIKLVNRIRGRTPSLPGE